jgi:uncharacterized membrane protein YfcA
MEARFFDIVLARTTRTATPCEALIMEFTFWQYLVMALLVGFAGFIDAIAGGGGLITVPTYLVIGLPTPFVLGTNKCVSTIGTTFAVIRYIRSGTILWRLAVYTIAAALVGSWIGAGLSAYLSKTAIILLLIILVPVIFYLQYRQRNTLAGDQVLTPAAIDGKLIMQAFFISFVIGGYDGLFGPGTGTFLLIAFLLVLKMSPIQAAANARIVNYASNLAAFFYFILHGAINWHLALIGIAASLTGNWLGSGYAIRKEKDAIFPIFRLVLILLLLKCGYDIYTMGFGS